MLLAVLIMVGVGDGSGKHFQKENAEHLLTCNTYCYVVYVYMHQLRIGGLVLNMRHAMRCVCDMATGVTVVNMSHVCGKHNRSRPYYYCTALVLGNAIVQLNRI